MRNFKDFTLITMILLSIIAAAGCSDSGDDDDIPKSRQTLELIESGYDGQEQNETTGYFDIWANTYR